MKKIIIAAIVCGLTIGSMLIGFNLYQQKQEEIRQEELRLEEEARLKEEEARLKAEAEEKARKDKLGKVEATVLRGYTQSLRSELDRADIPHNYLENVGKYTLFNIFCATQAQSAKAKEIMAKYEAKYFVSESKNL